MKQLTIHIPNEKFQLVVALLTKLKFVRIEKPKDLIALTNEQKASIDEELRKMRTDPNYAQDWDEVRHLIKLG